MEMYSFSFLFILQVSVPCLDSPLTRYTKFYLLHAIFIFFLSDESSYSGNVSRSKFSFLTNMIMHTNKSKRFITREFPMVAQLLGRGIFRQGS